MYDFSKKRLNFNLYFVERRLKPMQVTEVINLYARRTGKSADSPVRIDKFDVELNTAGVRVQKVKKQEGFDMKQASATPKPSKVAGTVLHFIKPT